MNNKGADQIAWMLICAFVVCIGQKQIFSWRGQNKIILIQSQRLPALLNTELISLWAFKWLTNCSYIIPKWSSLHTQQNSGQTIYLASHWQRLSVVRTYTWQRLSIFPLAGLQSVHPSCLSGPHSRHTLQDWGRNIYLVLHLLRLCQCPEVGSRHRWHSHRSSRLAGLSPRYVHTSEQKLRRRWQSKQFTN